MLSTADEKHCLDAFFSSLNPSGLYQLCDLRPVVLPPYAFVPSSKRSWQKLVVREHICPETSVLMAGQCLALSVAYEKCQGAQCLVGLLLGFILDATLGSSFFRVTFLKLLYLHNFRIKEKLQKCYRGKLWLSILTQCFKYLRLALNSLSS